MYDVVDIGDFHHFRNIILLLQGITHNARHRDANQATTVVEIVVLYSLNYPFVQGETRDG